MKTRIVLALTLAAMLAGCTLLKAPGTGKMKPCPPEDRNCHCYPFSPCPDGSCPTGNGCPGDDR